MIDYVRGGKAMTDTITIPQVTDSGAVRGMMWLF